MNRYIKTILAASLCAFTAQTMAATSNNMSAAQKAQIEEVVHDYLLAKPEVIMQAVQILQQRQYEEAKKTVTQTQKTAINFANALFHQSQDPTIGNPDGKITVVEFFDYQCPHCVDMAPVIEGIVKANPNLRIIFKEFPIRGPISEFASRAALAANKQGKYYPFSHAMLTVNKPLTQDLIFDLAKNNGVDVDQMKKDMNGPEVSDQLKKNMKLGQDLKLFGTPAIFAGVTTATKSIDYAPGQLDPAQLQQLIDKQKK